VRGKRQGGGDGGRDNLKCEGAPVVRVQDSIEEVMGVGNAAIGKGVGLGRPLRQAQGRVWP
jgi:hypothetical protein